MQQDSPDWSTSRNLSDIDIEHRYRLLIEAVQDYAIFMLDAAGNVASWNLGAQRIKGYSPDEIVGRHFSRFYTDEDIAAGKPAQLLATAAWQGRVEDEGWRVRKDESRLWANVVITAVHDEQGDLLGFAKITRDMTERRRLEDLEHASAASALVQQARENEQRRIARELHDDLGQQITALKMTLALHETELARHFSEAGRARLGSVREMADQLDAMATSMRRIAADLRPPMLDDLGLEAALEWMTEGFEQRYGVPVRCEISPDVLCLNDLAAISLYRVIQEALTNVARHARANEVFVTLSADDRHYHLQIHDDGVGLPKAPAPRADCFGLLGMRERISQLGGVLSVDSIPGRGVTITARVPLARVLVESQP
ncbi:PAS domain-containing sensor histidine kinase [Paraburkholderia phytofirmans]|uniref:histidine kinase n=1 Tax=Paraburkholderia phytofirmans (strain DSM 17436 / LMG 22146 / PsJN) TaxID=398527 RepID=B2TG29_PARPJ|nr:PAS domain-containing sensor histidine kinase [Paraburkholderia phytofirmans]ACD19903.1 PAS/PAC sensor signal transduction histidine kinase [Paraburkholderia phytofirmans PsJN]